PGQADGRAVLTLTCVGFDRGAAAPAGGAAISSYGNHGAAAVAVGALAAKGVHGAAARSVVAFTAAGNYAIAGSDGDAAEVAAAGGNYTGAADGATGAALNTQAMTFRTCIDRDSVAKCRGVRNH